MRRQLLCLLGLVVVTVFAHAQQFVEDSLKVDGYMRRFDVFLPKGIKPDAPQHICRVSARALPQALRASPLPEGAEEQRRCGGTGETDCRIR